MELNNPDLQGFCQYSDEELHGAVQALLEAIQPGLSGLPQDPAAWQEVLIRQLQKMSKYSWQLALRLFWLLRLLSDVSGGFRMFRELHGRFAWRQQGSFVGHYPLPVGGK